VGWLITGVVAAASIGVIAHRSARPTARASRRIWATATVALLAVGTLRAAGWLFVLCVLTAFGTGSLSVGGGSTVAGLVRGAFAVPIGALRGLPFWFMGLATLSRSGRASPVRVTLTLVVSAVLVLVFGGLFVSADRAFASLTTDRLPDTNPATFVRWIFVGTVVGLGTLGAAYLVLAPPRLDGAGASERPGRVHRIEWVLPLALLDALFAAFVVVQFAVLFGGERRVLEEAELTYAEYARGGFWQLLAVTVLTLGVLGAAARWAPREARVDRVLVRSLLGGLAGLTLVIVASALYRMSVYENAYGFTRLRVFVSVTELWLGLLFLMVLGAGVRLRARWLPRAVVGSAVAVLLLLAAGDPDRFIAERNIDRYEATGRIDLHYLSRLSADAVPALDRLPAELRDCALYRISAELSRERDDWREYNAARASARWTLADRPVVDVYPRCPLP
jgi:hypothetical protein